MNDLTDSTKHNNTLQSLQRGVTKIINNRPCSGWNATQSVFLTDDLAAADLRPVNISWDCPACSVYTAPSLMRASHDKLPYQWRDRNTTYKPKLHKIQKIKTGQNWMLKFLKFVTAFIQKDCSKCILGFSFSVFSLAETFLY